MLLLIFFRAVPGHAICHTVQPNGGAVHVVIAVAAEGCALLQCGDDGEVGACAGTHIQRISRFVRFGIGCALVLCHLACLSSFHSLSGLGNRRTERLPRGIRAGQRVPAHHTGARLTVHIKVPDDLAGRDAGVLHQI